MHKLTELFDHTYLIFKFLNFTTESSINCNNFVQDLHTTKVTFKKKEKKKKNSSVDMKIKNDSFVCLYLPYCQF